MKKLYKLIYAVFLLVLAFAGCDLSFLGSQGSYQYSLVNADTEISHIPTEDFFYVNIKSAYYTGDSSTFDPLDFELYALDEGPGTDCKISVNEQSSTEDLYCMLDVAEGDLWYHEINLEYNVPPGMCPYLGFYTHWHYNQEVGEGPRRVVEIETESADGDTNITYSPCTVDPPYYCEKRTRSAVAEEWGNWERYRTYSCPVDDKEVSQSAEHCIDGSNAKVRYKDAETGGTTVQEEETALAEYQCKKLDTSRCDGTYREEEKVCEYNKSEQDGKGNCCLGKYFLVRAGQTAEEKEWSGDISQCVGGLGRLSWQTFDDDGFPSVLVEEAGSKGLKKDYRLPQLIQSIKTRVSFPTANYFEGVEDKAGEGGENFPDFYNSRDKDGNINICGRKEEDKDGDEDPERCPTGNPYITWACLDPNQEELHRIHLIIREWNTKEELDRFKESEGNQGDSDIVGAGGSECEYYETEEDFLKLFGPCNDLLDADDWTSDYPEINYGGSSGS